MRLKKPLFRPLYFKIIIFLLYLFFAPPLIYQGIGYVSAAIESSDANHSLYIPKINLSTPVKTVNRNHLSIDVPDHIPGAYQPAKNHIFLLGHSSTIFKNLSLLKANDTFTFDQKTYQITQFENLPKHLIDMKKILQPQSDSKNSIIVMTCSGQHLKGQDYSHRLIITALEKD